MTESIRNIGYVNFSLQETENNGEKIRLVMG